MCSKYKKRNFMLPVKTGIPPNNRRKKGWNIYENFCDGKPRKMIRFGMMQLHSPFGKFRENSGAK